MIKIDGNRCEFQYTVDTNEKKVMNMLSPTSFEKACITADVHTLMGAIDQKYDKGTALSLFGLAVSHMYTLEEIEKAIKEIDEL
jgi:hypothetical protein